MARMGSVIMLTLLCAMAVGAVTGCKEYYVSPNGNDSWSGRLAEPNKDRTDGPFATLERARDAVRELKKQGELKEPVAVVLRKGVYYLDKPFVLTPEDSGTKDAPIVYTAPPGEDVTISGGRPISGFAPVEVNGHRMLAADVPKAKAGKWSFNQLFVNDRRASRTRLPKDGYYRVVDLAGVPMDVTWGIGQDKFTYSPGDLKPWKNLSDVDIVSLQFWVESRMPMKSIDEGNHTVQLAKKSTFRMTEDWSGHGARYFVENVFEALDTPGQWYLDRGEGKLYYYPLVGEDAKRERFTAPVLDQLVRVMGDAKANQSVEYVGFNNLKFAHTQYDLPADKAGDGQASVGVPGALYFENAKNCRVQNCDIAHIGGYGVEVASGCEDIDVRANRIIDLGGGGVKVHPGSERTVIADNDIGDGGKIFMSAIGVWVGNSPNNKVVHNHIHDFYYTGVSVGWVWGYGESKAKNNIIDHNHIHHVGRGVLSDLAGIYTLGISPGTRLTNNLIHDCISASYGGWGLYTDEGSSGIVLENNIVYHTKTGGFHQHYGKENIVQNNVFALATDSQLQRTREEEHTSFIFEHNIIYFDQGALLGSNWGNDHYKMDNNLYWDASGRPISFAGASFDDWKKRGHDVHSLIADPLFVNPSKFDFTLKPDSPAFKMGFRQIDLSTVGPREAVGPQKKL